MMQKTPSHTMELPRLIVVGESNIGQIGQFLKSLDCPKKVSVVAGNHVQKIVKKKIQKSADLLLTLVVNGRIRSVSDANEELKPATDG